MVKRLLFLSVSLVFVLEVWLLLTWGPMLGTVWTVVWIIGSFVLGLLLLRLEGVYKLMQIHRQLLAEELPARELLDLVLILLGAVMLILPGFATDIFGLCMLIPPLRWVVRRALHGILRRKFPAVSTPQMRAERPGTVVEIEISPEEDST